MSVKLATALALAAVVTASPARACMGSTVLFTDNFQTANPSWFVQPPATLTISGGYAQLTPLVGTFGVVDYEGGFFDSADGCVDVLSPAVADTTQAAAGLVFGMNGSGDFYVFAAEQDGHAAVLQWLNGNWVSVVAWQAAPALKTGGNVTNTLRVTWNGTNAATYINGQAFATLTISPLQNTKFGIWCEGDPSTNPTAAATYQFANIKLTNVPTP